MDFDWLKTRIQEGEIEQVLRDAADAICRQFNADRITIYRVTPDGSHLAAIVQTQLESFGALKVKLGTDRSVAGYVGSRRKLVNIGNAYDKAELEPLALEPRMLKAVDERTRYRTRQVLAAPVLHPKTGKLAGVVEILNNLDNTRFPAESEQAVVQLCAVLAPSLALAEV